MTKTQLFAILTAMTVTAHNTLAYEIHLEPDAAKRRTVTVYRSQGPETAALYLYAPAPWVIAGSAITAQDDNLWSGFNTTPNNPTHIYRMVNAHSSQQYVVIFGQLTQPGSGYGRNPWFKATVPSVDIDWERHAGAGHESDEDAWTGVCPVATNQSGRTKVIVRKLKDDLALVAPSMTLECWPADAARFLKEDGVTALWSGATVSDSETPLTLYVDPQPQYAGSTFTVTLLGPVDDAFNRPTDYLTGIVLSVEFKESAANNGFDDTTDPKWLVVPVNNPPNTKTAVAEISPSTSASSVDFEVSNTGKATVSPATASSGSQTVTLTGQAKGETALKAKVNSADCQTLNLSVKDKKTVKVSIHFIQDNAGHSTTTSDADAIVASLNSIFTPQANVVFTKHSADSPTIATDLGTCVEWRPTEPENEWDDVVAVGDSTADVNLYFVWEYEQDGTPATDNANAGTLGTDCIIEDNRGSRTIEHEVGHALGLGHNSGDSRAVMWLMSAGGTKIFKSEADTINP